MLTVIGLALDVVGAVVLVLGLFGHMQPSSFGGPVRSEEDAAHDQAFALVGAPLLILGFVFQALPNLGVTCNGTTSQRVTVGVVTLLAVAIAAFFAYGFLFKSRLEAEKRFRKNAMAGGTWSPRKPRLFGLRFWLH